MGSLPPQSVSRSFLGGWVVRACTHQLTLDTLPLPHSSPHTHLLWWYWSFGVHVETTQWIEKVVPSCVFIRPISVQWSINCLMRPAVQFWAQGLGWGVLPLVMAQFQHQHSLSFTLEETCLSSLGALLPRIKAGWWTMGTLYQDWIKLTAFCLESCSS